MPSNRDRFALASTKGIVVKPLKKSAPADKKPKE